MQRYMRVACDCMNENKCIVQYVNLSGSCADKGTFKYYYRVHIRPIQYTLCIRPILYT